jgi:hypothetical protein
MPKIAAATSSTGRPITSRPSNFVSSTDTNSGTRKIRATVIMFGRFISACPAVASAEAGLRPFYASVV